MSESHLIRVIVEGKVVVSQYGQSDIEENYQKIYDFFNGVGNRVWMNITGMGETAISHHIQNPSPFDMDHFLSKLKICRPITEAEQADLDTRFTTNGNMNLYQVDKFILSEYGHMHRNTSAAILPFIYNNQHDEVVLFLADAEPSIMRFDIDLDSNMLGIIVDGRENWIHLQNLPKSRLFGINHS